MKNLKESVMKIGKNMDDGVIEFDTDDIEVLSMNWNGGRSAPDFEIDDSAIEPLAWDGEDMDSLTVFDTGELEELLDEYNGMESGTTDEDIFSAVCKALENYVTIGKSETGLKNIHSHEVADQVINILLKKRG